jgi:hypothetical protein
MNSDRWIGAPTPQGWRLARLRRRCALRSWRGADDGYDGRRRLASEERRRFSAADGLNQLVVKMRSGDVVQMREGGGGTGTYESRSGVA